MHVWRTLVKMEAHVWTVEKVIGVSVYQVMEEMFVRQVSYLHISLYFYTGKSGAIVPELFNFVFIIIFSFLVPWSWFWFDFFKIFTSPKQRSRALWTRLGKVPRVLLQTFHQTAEMGGGRAALSHGRRSPGLCYVTWGTEVYQWYVWTSACRGGPFLLI